MSDLHQHRSRNLIGVSTLVCLVAIACADQPGGNGATTDAPAVTTADSIYGLVSVRNDTTCLRVVPTKWQPTDSVLIIVPADQRTIKASVHEAIPRCTEDEPFPDVRYFRLNAPDFQPGNVGVALLVPRLPVANGARTDLDGDNVPESYRSCTSGEGLHLTAWAGEPLTGRRIWHYYYYLGYDTEPTCVEADYIER